MAEVCLILQMSGSLLGNCMDKCNFSALVLELRLKEASVSNLVEF